MRFEMPFNAEESKEQAVVIFDTAWKNNLKKNNKLWLWIVFSLLLGILIVNGKDNLGYLFIFLALHYFIRYIEYRVHYSKAKKDYFNRVEDHIEGYKSAGKTTVWDFKEDVFCYSDYKYDLRINWATFDNFKVVGKFLFIELKDGIAANFTLSENDVGHDNFTKIIQFLEEKIKSK